MILPEHLEIKQELLAGAAENDLEALVCDELVRYLWVQRLHSGQDALASAPGQAVSI
jgi:hypothetical protein